MNNLAESFDSIFEADENTYDLLEADVIEFTPRVPESFPVNFLDELDGWVRHSLASNGFADV